VAKTGQEIIQRQSPQWPQIEGLKNEAGWMILSPVLLRDQVLGVLYLDSSLIGRTQPENDLPLLRAIGNQVAVALDNVQAYEQIAELRDRLEEETRFYRRGLEGSPTSGPIVGNSRAIRRVIQQINQVAPTDSAVLITGETGVGKELVAREIHRLSSCREGPFIPVNIAPLSEGLIASELFGHEKGAFTGAHRARRGRFELADRGTLFLDDVDNLSLDIQARLLRALQEKEFERVGGSRTIRSDFRLITATNQNLEELVSEHRFRSDLYYRLKVFPIHILPLRQRTQDIPLLVRHFLKAFAAKMNKNIKLISQQDMNRLTSYSWPGNVRELIHVIERAVILSETDRLNLPWLEDVSQGEAGLPLKEGLLALHEMERFHIISVLQRCGWKVSGPGGAAELLEVKPTTLYSKINRLGIKREVSYVMEKVADNV
jgi:transcriptional regulator with GAF, ATPase, and Fis domain